ncbi:MAG: thioredoxin family protein, partial [Lachnospiraceae bacterium]
QTVNRHNLKRLEKITSPHSIRICVSLACHYCSNTVIASQLLSSKNSNISSQMVDAALFPDIVEKYKLERIPFLILDETACLWGEKGIEDILTLIENNA